MTSADLRIDRALHRLGRDGDVVVLSLGQFEGISERTRGYAQRYGWREAVIHPAPTESELAAKLQMNAIDRIDVLHIETGSRDWQTLDQIDLARFRPKLVRLRRTSLRGIDLFLVVRLLQRRGYEIEWFYDEVVGLLADWAGEEEEEDAAVLRVPVAAAQAGPKEALYVISYNFPEQFRLWLDSVERANPELLASTARFLLDNSTDPASRPGYDELSKRYGFSVLRCGNLGITGGRVFCARQFDSLPNLEGLYWFEDDMLLRHSEAPPCRNGLRTYVPGVDRVVPAIVRRESLDFLKLSFTEFFGDHHLNWAWYHLSPMVREAAFPDGTFRTAIDHSGVEAGTSYIVGNLHYDNWPTFTTRAGNAELFLNGEVPQPTEGKYMARGFELQSAGRLRGGVLLASPIHHNRAFHYPREERREF
jgi:hypothetical protein